MEKLKVSKSNRCCSACKSRLGPMFHFPKKTESREEWKLFFGFKSATDYGQICSAHFRPEDVKECKAGVHRLVSGAQPCFKLVKSSPRNMTHRAAMTKCIVPGCEVTAEDVTSLHHFPRRDERRRQWATVLKIELVPSRNALICSNHFLPTDFRSTGRHKKLIKGATPSVNIGIPPDTLNEPRWGRENEDDDSEEIVVEPMHCVFLQENSQEKVFSDAVNNSVKFKSEVPSSPSSTASLPVSAEEKILGGPVSLWSHAEGSSDDSSIQSCSHEENTSDVDHKQFPEEAVKRMKNYGREERQRLLADQDERKDGDLYADWLDARITWPAVASLLSGSLHDQRRAADFPPVPSPYPLAFHFLRTASELQQ